jgi:hypothetical protein
MGTFRCYGENSFTFLFFQAVRHADRVQKILLPSLRQFGTGREFSEAAPEGAEPDIWLFPNFGRRYGFGEPDALLLLGGRCFWFEVETWVDLQTGRPALKKALLQLERFCFFQQALAKGAKVRGGRVPHRAILGPTVGNDGAVKQAALKVAGHPVLRKVRQRLATADPHYVLLCQGEPRGPGGDRRFEKALAEVLQEVSDELSATFRQWTTATGSPAGGIPTLLTASQCWYSYWNGYLERRFRAQEIPNPLAAGGYVGVRK